MTVSVAGAAVLAVAGGVAFYLASQGADTVSEDLYRVTINASACEPNEITVPGGKRSFEIVNTSERPIEWEILDGVMVVAERENIAPGFRQTLTTQLRPGDYAMTCGLLSNPRGVLHVTDSDEARDFAATVSLRDFLGPLSEYQVYLVMQGSAAVSAVESLAAAIEAGNLAEAQALWKAARLPYKRIEPVAYRFSDLENAIDPVAGYLEGREADPAFTGFHSLEHGLFTEASTQGLEPVAARLVADMTALRDRLGSMTLDPQLLLAIPGDAARHLAQGRIETGEDHYAHADLSDFAANFEGIEKVAGLLQQIVAPVDPALDREIAAALEAVRTQLSDLEDGGDYPSYETVDADARDALAAAFAALAQALGGLEQAIGVQ